MTLVLTGSTARHALRYPLAEELALVADSLELRARQTTERRPRQHLGRASLTIRRLARALDIAEGRAKRFARLVSR